MKKDYYKKESDNIRFSSFIILLAETKEMEMSLSDIWEKTKVLYYYLHPRFTNPIIKMGTMKRDIKMARDLGYLIMTGRTSTSKYVKTDLLKK